MESGGGVGREGRCFWGQGEAGQSKSKIQCLWPSQQGQREMFLGGVSEDLRAEMYGDELD